MGDTLADVPIGGMAAGVGAVHTVHAGQSGGSMAPYACNCSLPLAAGRKSSKQLANACQLTGDCASSPEGWLPERQRWRR